MAETLVPSGPASDDAGQAPATAPAVPGRMVDPAGLAAKARFEHELATFELADAAQAAARSAAASRSGTETDGAAQAELAARLYDSADRHRRTAERLELEVAAAPIEGE